MATNEFWYIKIFLRFYVTYLSTFGTHPHTRTHAHTPHTHTHTEHSDTLTLLRVKDNIVVILVS